MRSCPGSSMSKKSKSAAKHSRRRTYVVSRHGRHRFQSGIITAALMQRGLSMAVALELSTTARAEVGDRDEVSAAEIEAIIERLLTERGLSAAEEPRDSDEPRVRGPFGVLPFSRGVQLRKLVRVGVDATLAFALTNDLAQWIDSQSDPVIEQRALEAEAARRLREAGFDSAAGRYELIGWVRHADRPVLLFIGGATGTGKSTIATELAAQVGIRMMTGTDLIRETMRTVLSPHVVPGLHDHSFTAMRDVGQVLTNPRERVLLGFHQQAAQVGVGIRAVVRRALTEGMHLIVEGTHLVPPFRQYLPPGAEAHVAGMVLSIPDERTHRARFPQRGTARPGRPPEPYLEAFQAVRWIHDELVQAADDEGEIVVHTNSADRSFTSVCNYLAEVLPVSRARPVDERADAPPTLLLILDGLADEPNVALDGQTPLGAAHTPTLSTLTASGALGQVHVGDGITAPGTDEGIGALIASPTQVLRPIGRGLLEALGAGIPMPPAGILFRGNMATVQDDGLLADRRAGRIRAGVADLVGELRDVPLSGGITGFIYPGHEHRVVVVLKGRGLSAAVSPTDPGTNSPVQTIRRCQATDGSAAAIRTAIALEELLARAHRHLAGHPHTRAREQAGKHPANCVITRGAADVGQLPSRPPDHAAVAMVSGCATAIGLARAYGYTPATSARMTGNLDTDLDLKFDTVGRLLADHNLVVLHIKGTDIAAHDQKPLEKRDFITDVDAALGRFLQGRIGTRVAVTADHGTSSVTGSHMVGPVPLLLSTWSGFGEASRFDEEAAANGVLGDLSAPEFATLLRAPDQSLGPIDDRDPETEEADGRLDTAET